MNNFNINPIFGQNTPKNTGFSFSNKTAQTIFIKFGSSQTLVFSTTWFELHISKSNSAVLLVYFNC